MVEGCSIVGVVAIGSLDAIVRRDFRTEFGGLKKPPTLKSGVRLVSCNIMVSDN